MGSVAVAGAAMTLGSTGDDGKPRRGEGRGSRFFVLGRKVWERLLTVQTANQLNLVVTFLVLLAGTGSDHRLTKWSLKACDEHTGLGKPRARRAVQELIAGGLVELVDGISRLTPQYRLPDIAEDEAPIFLPVQMVTGFNGEASILRRVRETGDPLLLRMLIDLYGLVDVDATYGVSIANLRLGSNNEKVARKITEVGVHGLWALDLDQTISASGTWCSPHRTATKSGDDWAEFFQRLKTLRNIGGLWFEPWLFESEALDAEPMFPIDFSVLYSTRDEDEVSVLSRLLVRIAQVMTQGREYLLERHASDILIPLPLHHQVPALRGVAKLRIEPDSPGCRLAFARRKAVIEARMSAYQGLLDDVGEGRFDRPLGAVA
jgi:hypothetical protein